MVTDAERELWQLDFQRAWDEHIEDKAAREQSIMSDTDQGIVDHSTEVDDEVRRLEGKGTVHWQDESLPLSDRIRLAEAAGEWQYAGRLKRQLQRAQTSEQRAAEVEEVDVSDLRGEIEVAESAGEWVKAGRLKREMQRQIAASRNAEEQARAHEARQERIDRVAAERQERADRMLAFKDVDQKKYYGALRRSTGNEDIRGMELP